MSSGMDSRNFTGERVAPARATEETKPVEREFDAWQESLPKCRADCDGDLPGEGHEPNCPMLGKEFATDEDAFNAGWDAALERAALIAENEPRSWDANAPDPQHRIGVKIRALKGSR